MSRLHTLFWGRSKKAVTQKLLTGSLKACERLKEAREATAGVTGFHRIIEGGDADFDRRKIKGGYVQNGRFHQNT